MKHLGDITKISGYTVPPVDVITGGSPCQDLSVAGKRAGLAGERSGLFMEQIRIIKEMRENDKRTGRTDELVRPRYMVWENVPGAFSSNGGEDFRAVLEETAKIADPDAVIPRLTKGKWQPAGCIMGDGWSIAWRLHDAQFWGVPQRRKRISLVADFGGLTAPEILFERKGVSRDTEPGGTEREETAGDAGTGVAETGSISFQEQAGKPGGGKGILIQQERTGALSTLNNQSVCLPINTMVATRDNDEKRMTFGIGSDGDPQFSITSAHEHGVCVAQGCDVYNQEITGEVAASLTAASGGSNTSGPKVLSCGFKPRNGACSRSVGYEKDMVPTISTDRNVDAVYTVDQGAGKSSCSFSKELSPTLSTTHGGEPAVVYGISAYDSGAMKSNNPNSGIYKAETSRTIDINGGNPACNQGGMAVVCIESDSQRESHQGDGYVQSETIQMRGGQETDTNDMLNTFDNGEARTPTAVVYKKATVYDWHRQDTRMTELGDVCVTAAAGWGGGGNNMPYVLEETVEDGTFCVGNGQANQTKLQKKVGALNCMHDQQTIMVPDVPHSETCACTAVDCRNGTEESIKGYIVRRLTPTECERLQGYPDGWTDIGEWTDSKGKRHKDADSPRYKALGNSIALPFWCWMAERMVQYLGDTPTMASLFDGIGGFPFAFSRVGCTPVWASEIEEFPIAVTRIRFPEEGETK